LNSRGAQDEAAKKKSNVFDDDDDDDSDGPGKDEDISAREQVPLYFKINKGA
jgi:hypothetical protein